MPLRDLARTEIEAMERTGVRPTAAEIVQLNDLAGDVELAGQVDPSAAGGPCRAGNHVAWPFTLASGEWFAQVIRNGTFSTSDGIRNALIFALCNGRTFDFGTLITSDDSRSAVNRWILRAGMTAVEREQAIMRVCPEIAQPHTATKERKEWEDPEPEDAGADSLVAELVAGTGLDADYWRRQSQSAAVACLRAIYRQAAVGAGVSDEDKTAYRRAMARFDIVASKIRQAHSGEA